MQTSADFRSRVRAVRMESKSFLQAIRAERLARVRDAGGDDDQRGAASAPVAESTGLFAEVPPAPQPAAAEDSSELAVSALAARVSRRAQAAPVEGAADDAGVVDAASEPQAVAEDGHGMSQEAAEAVPAQPADAAAEMENDPADEGAESASVPAEFVNAAEDAARSEGDGMDVAEENPADVAAIAEMRLDDPAPARPDAAEVAAPIVEDADATAAVVEVEDVCDAADEALANDPVAAVEAGDGSVDAAAEPCRDTPEPTQAPIAAVYHLRPTDAGPTEPDLAESDLDTLPGAGPGLVWMLRKLGVSSLADLSVADPHDLRERFGLIGQLIDLSAWIDFARARVAAEAR